MIKSDCNIKNPLVRDGASQPGRLLKALYPEYVKIDERSIEDLLNFIYKYSEKIQYYNSENEPDGSWKEFIENDISTIISLISQKDLKEIKACIAKHFKTIHASTKLNVKTQCSFKNIFLHLFYVVDEINSWYNRSITGLKLNTELKQSITAGLRQDLKTIIAAYKYGTSNYLFADNNSDPKCSALKYLNDFTAASLNPIWVLPGHGSTLTWNNYSSGIAEDDALFGNEDSELKKIKYAAENLEAYVERFIGAQSRVINLSSDFLEETLRNYPSHEPHMALFLAFIQLLDVAKKDLNGITKKHLDFFYKDALSLKNTDEIPDTVHVIFNLAKQTDSYEIKNGTQLKAGKDSTGVEVIYQVDEDAVINKASVEQLKTVFIDKDDKYRIYSAEVANSKDGNGADFDTTEPRWKTFGQSQIDNAGSYLVEDERTMEFTEIGFAVSSPILFLSEGERIITVSFETSGTLPSGSLDKTKFSAYLSTQKEWTAGSIEETAISSGIIFKIKLGVEIPPIISFNNTELEDDFDSDFPILKIVLNNSTAASYDYNFLKDIYVTGINMKVEVNGMKNVVLQNDAGIMKSAKPFYPFTTTPGAGSNFYIGSKEILQKDLSYLKFAIEWKDVPAGNLATYYANYGTQYQVSSNNDFKVSCKVLINSVWVDLVSADKAKTIFGSANAKESYNFVLGNEDGTSSDFDNYKPGLIEEEISEYQSDTQNGFLKFVLENPAGAFGHKYYRDAYTKAMVVYSNKPDAANATLIPKEPYTPFINSLSIDYNASEKIDLDLSDSYETDESKFYHLYPFGYKPARKKTPSKINLLPQFDFETETQTLESEGELYIGIKDLNPPENVSLLFQLAEGSADPELPTQKIYWSYLSSDEWKKFDVTEIISDTTNGLIKSGIIEFSIPGEATDENTILPNNLRWIRACVDQNSGAVCDCIEILAQAIKAVFVNNGNDPNFLSAPIESGTITGLKIKDANIKKVEQPYSSLGGKTEESDEQFYIRISERLRHKNRGISIWDYERIVLQEFPSIYKVKCVNHSTYIPQASEFAPGYVSVIVIPSLLNINAVNPLEPRAPVSSLNEIKEFLQKKISPLAAETIQVLNPLYEKIKVEFKVKFYEDNFGYYSKKLEEDIIRFLSPWAFGEKSEVSFGGKVYKSVILNFVEERDYVDYVTDFKMIHVTEDENGKSSEEYKNEIVATCSRSILVSNSTHLIKEAGNS